MDNGLKYLILEKLRHIFVASSLRVFNLHHGVNPPLRR